MRFSPITVMIQSLDQLEWIHANFPEVEVCSQIDWFCGDCIVTGWARFTKAEEYAMYCLSGV